MWWPWKRRCADDWQRHWDEHDAWTNSMTARGWHHWMWLSPPPFGEPLELSRQEWPAIRVVGSRAEVGEACNINGLWWRPCYGPMVDGQVILELRALPVD
jgi:hypothetical protein